MMVQDIPAEVIVAQFAGGMTIARLALEWDLDEAAVELAIRHQVRLMIPRWAGGLKPSRDEMRKCRDQGAAVIEKWPALFDV